MQASQIVLKVRNAGACEPHRQERVKRRNGPTRSRAQSLLRTEMFRPCELTYVIAGRDHTVDRVRVGFLAEAHPALSGNGFERANGPSPVLAGARKLARKAASGKRQSAISSILTSSADVSGHADSAMAPTAERP